MSYALILPNQHQQSPVGQQLHHIYDESAEYRRFFDFDAAYQAVINHVDGLPSARTPERHTHKNYSVGLDYFLDFLRDRLPTTDIMKEYIAHLRKPKSEGGRGLASNTISAKYLTPARHFCKALGRQPLPYGAIVDGKQLFGLPEWRDQIRQAAEVENPKPDTTTNIAPLWNPKFKRLSLDQVNAVLRAQDRGSLVGSRNYALLLFMFSSAMRIAETQRLTQDNISAGEGAMLITVRRKRMNEDPVGVGTKVIAAIDDYCDIHNRGLAADDPRRILPGTVIWQPYMHNGVYAQVGYNKYCADGTNMGISIEAIRGIIATTTGTVLGKKWALAAHDTRRTAAAIAYDNGMPLNELQALLGHKSPAQTLAYIGVKPDYERRTLSTYVQFG